MATSPNQSGFVNNWQNGKSVSECNLYMLETEDFTDVTFRAGSKKHVVRAHRYVLASRSCVFRAMFCGLMAEQGEITIPDIETNVFKDFLRFLYTDKVTITSTNVAGLLYSSRKYDVETLLEKALRFLDLSLSVDNLCEILEQSHEYGETDLERKALKMLCKATPSVTESPKFLDLCSYCFEMFLKSEQLRLQEEEIFKAAFAWTKAECKREGLSPSHKNMRKILGKMVFNIRFATLSLDFLTKVVGPSGILSDGERVKVMDKILDSNVDISPFKSKKRNAFVVEDLDIRYVNRFKSTHTRTQIMKYETHAIKFFTNKNISLVGCQMYGSGTPFRASLSIQVYDERGLLISSRLPMRDSFDHQVNDIMFPAPITIDAERMYTICTSVPPGTDVEGFDGGKSYLCEDHVEFTFMVSDYGSYSAVQSGQVPGLIWTSRN